MRETYETDSPYRSQVCVPRWRLTSVNLVECGRERGVLRPVVDRAARCWTRSGGSWTVSKHSAVRRVDR